jgi:hypothetical protein
MSDAWGPYRRNPRSNAFSASEYRCGEFLGNDLLDILSDILSLKFGAFCQLCLGIG